MWSRLRQWANHFLIKRKEKRMGRQEIEERLRALEIEIMECHGMIDHFIALNNREEIHYWRTMLQGAKVKKREMKNMLKLGEAAI